ncbi:MAG: hypothetical protein ACI9R3_004948, partial [Verrucomicrobiales bacterium]
AEMSAAEIRLHFASSYALKSEICLVTVCHRLVLFWFYPNNLTISNFREFATPSVSLL